MGMANAKKCDRCGKYYDKNTLYKTSKLATMDDNFYRKNTYDVCDDCTHDFIRFMSGVKLEDDSKGD